MNTLKKYNLPCYEWNMIDVATRARFTADFYELSSTFGFMFILFFALWLRTHNVRNQIKIRLDNGAEFCGGSEKKLKEWNEMLSFLGVELNPIPPKAKQSNGYIDEIGYLPIDNDAANLSILILTFTAILDASFLLCSFIT